MKVYPSRISVSVLVFFYAIMAYAGFNAFQSGEIPAIIIFVCILLLVSGIFFTTRYYVDPETKTLKVRVLGIPNGSIDLTQVREIRKSRSILSSPAISLDRILLDVKGGPDVLLSPRYQQDFLEEIKKINPDVKIDERLLIQ